MRGDNDPGCAGHDAPKLRLEGGVIETNGPPADVFVLRRRCDQFSPRDHFAQGGNSLPLRALDFSTRESHGRISETGRKCPQSSRLCSLRLPTMPVELAASRLDLDPRFLAMYGRKDLSALTKSKHGRLCT